MPQYIQLPNGTYVQLREGQSPSEGMLEALDVFPEAFGFGGQAAAPAAGPREGILASLQGGAERLLSTGRTALGAIVDPEAAAQAGIARGQDISSRIAPGADLEKVKQVYRERGLLPAAGEVISQIPSALAEQAPQIAATLGTAKAGAVAGSAFGPAGTVVGGLTGAVAPSLLQLFGSNIERQAAEQQAAGAPVDVDRGAALAAAVPAAGLEVAATFIPFGRTMVGKILGPNAERALGTATGREMVNQGLTRTLTQGAATGIAAEVPTEVIQQMLERAQAGLDLTSDEALAEYGQAAYGAALVGTPVGAGGRFYQRSVQRGEQAAEEQQRALEEQQRQRQEREAYESSQEYLLDVEQRFLAARDQLAALQNQKRKIDRKSATAEEDREFNKQLEAQIKTLREEPSYRELLSQYTKLRPQIEKAKEQAALEAMSPEEFMLRQQGLDVDTRRPFEREKPVPLSAAAEKGADVSDIAPAQPMLSAEAPLFYAQQQIEAANRQAREQAISDQPELAMAGFDAAEGVQATGQQIIDALASDPRMVRELLRTRPQLPGMSRSQSKLVLDGLQNRFSQATREELQNRQALLQQQQMLPETEPDLFAEQQLETAEDTFLQRFAYDKNLDIVAPLLEQATAGTEPAVAPPQGVTASNRSASLVERLDALEQQIAQTRNNEERQNLLDQRTQLASTADADPNLRTIYDTRSQAEDALMELESSLDDLRTGTFMGGENQGAASSLPQTLVRRIDEAKKAYIRSVLQEAATLRRIRGERGLTTDEALQAADRINTELDELINRSQAVREVEEVVTQPAQMRGTQIVSPAQTAMRDVRPLEQRPFGKYRAALGTILDSVDQTRRSLLAPVSQPRVESPLLRTQFASNEAQRVAEERGETATTLGGELRRRTEFVRNKMSRMGGMRPQARDVLNRAADLMDEGRVTRDLLTAVEDVVDTINRGQMPFARDLRAITDVMAAMEETPAGQRELFDAPADKRRREEEIGYIRATAENFEKAPMVRKARAAIDNVLQPAIEREERRRTINTVLQEVKSRIAELENKLLAIAYIRPEARGNKFFMFDSDPFLGPLSPEKRAKLSKKDLAARVKAEEIQEKYKEFRERFNERLEKAAQDAASATAPLVSQKGVLERQVKELNKQLEALSKDLQDPKLADYRASLKKDINTAAKELGQQRLALQNATVVATARVRAAETAQLEMQNDAKINAARKVVDEALAALALEPTYAGVLRQQQRLAMFKPGEQPATEKRIRKRIEKLEAAIPEDVKNKIEKLKKTFEKAQQDFDAVLASLNAEVDGAYIRQLVSLDDKVKFERATFKRMQDKLDSMVAESRDSLLTPEIKALSAAATEQRARVASAEKAQREAQEAADKKRADFKERLARGLDLPSFSTADTPQRKTLRVRIEALEAALDTPSPELTALQQRLAEQEAQPVDKAQKQRVAYTKRRIALAEDKYAAQQEEMQAQLREFRAKLGSYEALSQQQRAEEKAAEQMSRERAVDFDPLAVIGVKKPGRATGPVTRAQSAAPAQLRTETPESRAGESRAPVDRRMGEARGAKERNVPVNTSEMQEANRLAEELRKKSPKEKEKEAREAAAVARELQKAQSQYSEGDFDALESAVRDTVYDSRPTYDLRANTAEAVEDGRILDALQTLESNGSTDFVKQLAARLRPLVMRTKLRVVDNLTNQKGVPVEGLFSPENNTVFLDRNGLNEESFLHEVTHAVTINALRADPASLTPAQRQAVQELRSLYEQVQSEPAFKNEYAKKSLEEFVAELMSNQQVRTKLDAQQPSLLRRIYNSILEMLGMKPMGRSEKAVQDAYAIFAPSKPSQGAVVASMLRGVMPKRDTEFGANVPASVANTINRTVGRNPTVVDRIMANVSGLAFRTQILDRYAPIERLLEKGVEKGMLTGNQSFQTQYYLRFGEQRNQYVAQAASSAVPQLIKNKDGDFTIEAPAELNEKTGANLRNIAMKLQEAGIGDEQAVEKMFTTYLAILRAEQDGTGYDKLNFEKPLTPEEAADVKNFVQSSPKIRDAFEAARKEYRDYNNNLLDLMQQTGALDKETVAKLKAKEYVPYYRNDNGIVNLIVGSEKPVRIGNIIDQPYLKELVGGKEKILPFFTGAMQNTAMLMDMSLRNMQTKETAVAMSRIGVLESRNGITFFDGEGPADPRRKINFKVDGKLKHAFVTDATELYGVPADLLVQGMSGIKIVMPAALSALAIPANVLRKMVTRAPVYALRQPIRESINGWMVTGGNFTPVASAFKELAKIMQGKSATERTLQGAGAISSNVFTGDIQDIQRSLRDISAGQSGWEKLMTRADTLAVQGDAATRAVLYDTYRKQGMTHMQALLGALEVMNFGRRGLSPSIQMMSMMVPFFSAQIQGMDVIYRSMAGKSTFEQQMNARRKLFARGMMMAGMTMAYAAMMEDDEAYKNATPEQRALNWFVYFPGIDEPVKIPIPFELGYLFKALPELFMNVASGDTKAEDAAKTFGKLAYNTVPLGLPQAIKPGLEVVMNYSLFTGAPVESAREQTLLTEERFRSNTTELAKALGQFGVVSPVQIDYLIRGYTGGLGIAIASIPNFVVRPFTMEDDVELPEKRLSQNVLIGGLFQPVDGRAVIDAAYKEVDSMQKASQTYKRMIEQGRRADAQKFAQDYSREIALASFGGTFRQQMGEFATLRRQVEAAPGMSAQEKRAKLDQIRQLEIRLAQKIRELAKAGE